jgi:vacuolar-type H+-ATPase subunit H
MEDLETLKIIREKEDSINKEIALLKSEKEKQLQEMETQFSLMLKENEENLRLQATKEVAEVSEKAKSKADNMVLASREKAENLKMKLSDRDIEKIASDLLKDYLEGI